ncbi:MAG: metallopeptidase family protein, partial [Ignavibacteria bacterium]
IMELAMGSIPELFKSKMDNIVFLIEQYPTDSDLERVGLKEKTQLLGLYAGIPYTHRNTWYAGSTPDRIILFQKNIESICRTKDELINKIKEVVIHEIAHYFGMSDAEIRKAGY